MAGNFSAPGARGWLGRGSRIGGYVIEEKIGHGGLAVVFRARDERLDRLVAVKVLSPTLVGHADFRARFLHECQLAAALEEPHIVPVYGVGEDAGSLYVATRFVAGGDLASLVERAGGRLDPARVASLVAQVAAALDAVVGNFQ